MNKIHHYSLTINWVGNTGEGTKNYQSYERDHLILVDKKPVIKCSSDTNFRGNPTMHNPEELFLASISSCHMLWYLHLCSDNGIIVRSYVDNAVGTMTESGNEGGKFTSVTLHPIVTITDALQMQKAIQLHSAANKYCFIANSLNFTILHEPVINIE